MRNKGKTVYFKDIVKKIVEDQADRNNIDPDIVREVIRTKIKNRDL